ncbi:hypothetical protein D9M68_482420 [compost metagenome]
MLDLVRQVLVVVARHRRPAADRLAVQVLQHRQQHHARNPAAARRAEGGEVLLALDEGGAHGGQRALARAHRVGLAGGQAIGIGAGGVGGEIVHLVVQQHAGAGHGEGGTERQVDGQGGGHCVAILVDHREVGGVVAFAPGWRGRQGAAGGGAARVDAGGKVLEVARIEQLRLGNGDEVRVAQQAAIAVGPAQDFHHVMAALHPVGLAPGQLLQHRQALGQGDTAGRGRRRADQLAAFGQAEADRLALDGAVAGQVAQAPDAAGGVHALHQLFGGQSAVETGLAIAGDAFQGVGQLRLAQQAEFFRDFALVVEEQPCGLGVVAHGRQAPAGAFAVDAVHRNAVPRQADGRGQAVVQRQAAILAGDIRQCRRQAGNGGGKRAVQGQARISLAIAHVEPWVGGQGRTLAGVEEAVDGLVAALAEQEEAAAAKARAIRLGHRQRGADGDRGIEGVAALGQGLEAGYRGRRVGRGDGRAPRFGGLQGSRAEQEQGRDERATAVRAAFLAAHGSGLAGELQVLVHQLILAFDMGLIEGNAVDRADLLALGLVVVADALGAEVGIDHVDLLALGNGAVWALGFADVAVDAVVGDLEGHGNNSCRRQAAAALYRN